jgi:hypothetical protein
LLRVLARRSEDRNFRSHYYEKVGFRGMDERKMLDNILKDDPVSHEKCVNFAVRCTIPASDRLHVQSRDLCYDFLNIFAKKFGKKLAFLTQNKAKICKILIITLVFEKKTPIFAPKIVIITSTPVANPTTLECTTTTPALYVEG